MNRQRGKQVGSLVSGSEGEVLSGSRLTGVGVSRGGLFPVVRAGSGRTTWASKVPQVQQQLRCRDRSGPEGQGQEQLSETRWEACVETLS